MPDYPLMTYVEAVDPAVVGKTIGPDGSDVRMNYRAQTFSQMPAESQEDVAAMMGAVKPGRGYLMAGVAGPASGTIDVAGAGGALRRTAENFPFPRGPGFMFVDCDETKDAATLQFELDAAAPGMGDVAMVWRPSASSFIFNGNEQVSDLKGAHAIIAVKDASDIPRAGEVLFKRLWLVGCGRIRISRAGVPLERAPFDRAMLKSCQPLFVGGAYCEEPFRQNRPDPKILPGQWLLDTRAVLKDLTPAEEKRFQALVIAAKHDVAEEAAAICAAYRQEKAMKRAREQLGPDASEEAIQALAATLEAAQGDLTTDAGHLPMGHIIELKGRRTATVSEILADPKRFHGVVCYDPASPEYEAGILYTNQSVPVLHSEAGPKPTWKLGSDDERRDLEHKRRMASALQFAWLRSPAEVRRDFFLRALARWGDGALPADVRAILKSLETTR